MARHRVRVAKGIYRDESGLGAIVTVGKRQRELRYRHGTAFAKIRYDMELARQELRELAPVSPDRQTFEADAEKYKRLMGTLASRREAWSEVKAWIVRLGPLHRSAVGPHHVYQAMAEWSAAKVAPKTINNRINRLARMWHVLDGRKRPTPCDGIPRLTVPKRPPVRIADDLIVSVLARLKAGESSGTLRTPKTRARFLVLATTGRRPCEVMRARPEDVDLPHRVWTPRDAKGGYSPGIYLNDDMIAAWTLFSESKAWGPYETSAFARTIRTAGWPDGIAPYQLRHTVGLRLSESGVDLADVQAIMGHKHITTTRKHYVPVLHSRIQKASEQIDGRLTKS